MPELKINEEMSSLPWNIRFLRADEPEDGFFIEAKNYKMPQLGYGIEIMQEDFGEHNGYPFTQRLADANAIVNAVSHTYGQSLDPTKYMEIISAFAGFVIAVENGTYSWSQIVKCKDIIDSARIK